MPVICSNQGGTPEIVKAARGGRISQCDDDINFADLVDLHHPPMPDIDEVVRDAEEAFSQSNEIVEGMNFEAVDIRYTAKKYITFCETVLNS